SWATGALSLDPPALLTRMSMRPYLATVSSISRSQSSRTEESPCTKWARSPASISSMARAPLAGSRPLITTLAPSRRKASPIARPIPRVPPLITATRPSSSPMATTPLSGVESIPPNGVLSNLESLWSNSPGLDAGNVVIVPAFAAELARVRPDQIALRDPDQTHGWAQVDDILNRVTNQLVPSFDLGPDRRVAVFAENAAETALAHLGALLAGASSVPVNFHLTADEAAYILGDSQSRVVFAGPETLERALAAVTAVATGGGVRPLLVAWDCPP